MTNLNTLKEFKQDLLSQNLAKGTIKNYLLSLKKLPEDEQERIDYLIENKQNTMLIYAYRKYLHFQKKKGLISIDSASNQLDTYKPPKNRGKLSNGKWLPRKEWGELISRGSSRCAKLGIWLALQFGLRVGEVVNLRVEDIDLDNKYVHIQTRIGWTPKHNRNRSVPIAAPQKETLKKWIKERPDLDHPYLIYSSRNKQITERTFQRWVKNTNLGIKPHDLRRSFAKVLYYDSNKDLKLVQVLLGHSNISTTSLYLGLDVEEIHAKYERAMG